MWDGAQLGSSCTPRFGIRWLKVSANSVGQNLPVPRALVNAGLPWTQHRARQPRPSWPPTHPSLPTSTDPDLLSVARAQFALFSPAPERRGFPKSLGQKVCTVGTPRCRQPTWSWWYSPDLQENLRKSLMLQTSPGPPCCSLPTLPVQPKARWSHGTPRRQRGSAQPSPAQGSRADAFDLKDIGAADRTAQTCLEEGTAYGLQMLQAKRTRCGLSCIPARAASPSSSNVCPGLSAAGAGAALGSASTVINVCVRQWLQPPSLSQTPLPCAPRAICSSASRPWRLGYLLIPAEVRSAWRESRASP